MKIDFCLARNLATACLLIICAACGSTPPTEENPAADTAASGNFFMGTSPIFAHLVNNKDGSWTFRTITASDEPPESAYLVRLNDLSPAFDTRVAECMPQLYPEAHRCNPASPFRNEESGVLEKIINGSIAVSTGGKITDITAEYETTFDETAFNRAVDEALASSSLDRRRLIALLASYDEELRIARAELQAANERMQALSADADSVAVEVEPTIAGLTEYYEGDIDFAQLVDLEPASTVAPQLAEFEATPVLPCDARNCVVAADTALARLRAHVQMNKEQTAAGMRPSSRLYKVRCNMVSYAGYLLQAECPTEVVAGPNEPARVPVSVTILSRDFVDLYPEFEIEGPELQITIDGQDVTFSNTTSEYLTVSAQTVYYNSTVHTTSHIIEVPPGISVTRGLEEFVSQSIDIESRYLQMTPDKARGASFQFGFAVRYQLASNPEGRTLHDVATFNVDCVIRERMAPGSCRPESLADASVPTDTPKSSPRPGAPM